MEEILLVDVEDAAPLEAALARKGLMPLPVRSGDEALDVFCQRNFAAVIIMLSLGGEDATEIAYEIRSLPQGDRVPILFIGRTGRSEAITSLGQALAAGADFFFKLPTDLEHLAERVFAWTRTTQSTDDPPSDSFELPPVEGSTEQLSPDDAALLRALVAARSHLPNDTLVEPAMPLEQRLSDDHDPLQLVREAESLRGKGAIDEAVFTYAEAARQYEAMDEQDPALSLYRLVLHLDPSHSKALDRVYQMLTARGRTDTARVVMMRALDGLEAREDHEAREGLLSRLLRQHPHDAELLARSATPTALGAPKPQGTMPIEAVDVLSESAADVPLIEEILPAMPLAPSQGRIESATDGIELLAQMIDQKCTGQLNLRGGTQLVIAGGLIGAQRGSRSVQSLLRLLRESGRGGAHAGYSLLLAVPSERPAEVARELVNRGQLEPLERDTLLWRMVEAGVGALLDHRGGWWFDGQPEVPVVRHEITDVQADMQFQWAAELLARRPAMLRECFPRLHEAFVRRSPNEPADLSTRRGRFLSLLDGQSEVGRIADLVGMDHARAGAEACVEVARGAAVRLPKLPSGRYEGGWQPLGGSHTPGERYAALDPAETSRRRLSTQELASMEPLTRLQRLEELAQSSDWSGLLGLGRRPASADIDRAYARLTELVPLTSGGDNDGARVQEVLRNLTRARERLLKKLDDGGGDPQKSEHRAQ